MMEQTMSISMCRLTRNEINNIIYLALKHTFGLKPENLEIYKILMEVVDDPTIERIIDSTFDFVAKNYSDRVDGNNRDKQLKHFRLVINEFLKLPIESRNSLGKDANSDDLITKH
jgi:hypothetical protein